MEKITTLYQDGMSTIRKRIQRKSSKEQRRKSGIPDQGRKSSVSQDYKRRQSGISDDDGDEVDDDDDEQGSLSNVKKYIHKISLNYEND